MLTQDNSDLAQHNVYEAMSELGASRAGERKEARGNLNDFADKRGKKRGSKFTGRNDYPGPIQGDNYPEMAEAMEGRGDDSEEDTDPDLEEEGGEEEALGQAMERLRQSRSYQHPKEDGKGKGKDLDTGFNGLMNEPSGGTVPFGASGGVEGGAKTQLTPRSGKTRRVFGIHASTTTNKTLIPAR